MPPRWRWSMPIVSARWASWRPRLRTRSTSRSLERSCAPMRRWLGRDPPELDKVRQSVDAIVRDGTPADEIIRRIRALVTKVAPAQADVDVNGAVLDVIEMTRRELRAHSISFRTELATGLLRFEGTASRFNRFRSRHQPGGPRAPLRPLLHDQADRNGHGAVDLPLDHRIAWRAHLGRGKRAARGGAVLHSPRQRLRPVVTA